MAPLRVDQDSRNEKLSYTLREGLERKVPYIIVVGGRDEEAGTVALRHKNAQETLPLAQAVARLNALAQPPDGA